MTHNQVLLILASVGLSGLAQVLLKLGTAGAHRPPGQVEQTVLAAYQVMLTSPLTLSGLAAYALGAVLWLRVLSMVDLSQAYPFVALGFVITAAAGVFLLDEPVVATRVVGMGLILVGVMLVAYR